MVFSPSKIYECVIFLSKCANLRHILRPAVPNLNLGTYLRQGGPPPGICRPTSFCDLTFVLLKYISRSTRAPKSVETRFGAIYLTSARKSGHYVCLTANVNKPSQSFLYQSCRQRVKQNIPTFIGRTLCVPAGVLRDARRVNWSFFVTLLARLHSRPKERVCKKSSRGVESRLIPGARHG
jgi:hypothetical protein